MSYSTLSNRDMSCERKSAFKIRVLYTDKSRGYIDDYKLEKLASKGLIVAYSLPGADEWVNVKKRNP